MVNLFPNSFVTQTKSLVESLASKQALFGSGSTTTLVSYGAAGRIDTPGSESQAL